MIPRAFMGPRPAQENRRIAIFSFDQSPLCSNAPIAKLARNLALQGHSVDVFTRRDHEDLPEILEWNDVQVIPLRVGPPRLLRNMELAPLLGELTASISEHMRAHEATYDLLHASSWLSARIARRIKRVHSIPMAVTWQFPWPKRFSEEYFSWKSLARAMLVKASA